MAIFKAIDKSSKNIGGSKGVLDYVGKKAENTVGIKCSNDYKEAFKDFQDIKEFYNKLEDRQYKHFTHSFKPGEIDKERALEMTVKLCEEIFPENQVFIAQHTDRKHIHNHIVVNSVNFENGEKFYYEEKEFDRWRDRADELAQEYGLEIVQPKEKELKVGEIVSKSRDTREVIGKAMNGEKKSDIVTVSLAVIQAGQEAESKEDFTRLLKEKGVDIDWGETTKEDGSIKYKKYITLTVDENHRVSKKPKFRLDSLENHIHHPAFNTEKLREHFKELEKKKELEIQKKKEKENSWEKRLKTNQHRRATCLAVLHIYQSIRKHPARFFSSCRVFSYAIQTQQKPESFLRIAFLFWVEFVNETNSSISKQVRPLNSTRMSFAFNINSITFSSCL